MQNVLIYGSGASVSSLVSVGIVYNVTHAHKYIHSKAWRARKQNYIQLCNVNRMLRRVSFLWKGLTNRSVAVFRLLCSSSFYIFSPSIFSGFNPSLIQGFLHFLSTTQFCFSFSLCIVSITRLYTHCLLLLFFVVLVLARSVSHGTSLIYMFRSLDSAGTHHRESESHVWEGCIVTFPAKSEMQTIFRILPSGIKKWKNQLFGSW